MDDETFHLKSIAELHIMIGIKKSPTHPLISIIDSVDLEYKEAHAERWFTSDLYCIALKDKRGGVDYGRNYYDFNEGVLVFTGPNQKFRVLKSKNLYEPRSWMLYFHPDLIRNMYLGKLIDEYTFFNYKEHEALHLSGKEQEILNSIISLIRMEVNERIDNYSQKVLVSNIQLILDYSVRYYDRQMNICAAQNNDVVRKVETLLKHYLKKFNLIESGQPTIEYLSGKCRISSHYLNDLLIKETGRSVADHVNKLLIEKAKRLLLNSTDSVSDIGYTLGFKNTDYFRKLFKQKTGIMPQNYRQVN